MSHSIDNVSETPHFTYIWTVENMCEPCFVESPLFTVNQMEMTKWRLAIVAGNSDCIELDVFRCEEDDGPKAIEIKVELSFLGIDGLPIIGDEGIKMFKNDDVLEFEEFVDKDEVFFRRRKELMPKDELTIRCRMWRKGTEISQIDSCFARTRLHADRHSFVWAIREFSNLQRNHEYIILLNNRPTHELTFTLHGTENDCEKYIGINTNSSIYNFVMLKICLFNFEGKVVHAVEKNGHGRDDFQFDNFFEKRKLINDASSLLPNDVLLLRCEIETMAKIIWSKIENYTYLNSKNCLVCKSDDAEVPNSMQDETYTATSSFTEAMRNSIERTSCDVDLRAGSTSFPAHMCLLSALSPVFEDMFRGAMEEKTRKCIEIPDVDENTLGDLVSYIYSNKLGNTGCARSIALYRAADRYKMLDLKRKCSEFLKSDLSVSSVCAILCVADMHNDTELREAVQDFVMQQGTEFFTTDTWLKIKVEDSLLAFEILERKLFLAE